MNIDKNNSKKGNRLTFSNKIVNAHLTHKY